MSRLDRQSHQGVDLFSVQKQDDPEAIATWGTGATVATAALGAVGPWCASAAEPVTVPPAVAALVPTGWTVLAHATATSTVMRLRIACC